MRQLVILMIQYLFVGLCDMVDTAFINNTGVDAICVLSAYSVVLWSANKLIALGKYAYRVNRKNKGTCLCLTALGCSALFIILFFFNKPISRLYSLTEIQYSMLEDAILVLGIFCFLRAFGDFCFEYLLLKEENKLALGTNTVFYICMILLDAIVFFTTRKFVHFLLATVVAYLVYDIIVVIYSDFLKDLEKPSLKLIKEYGKQGLDIVCDQIVGKVATFIYNIYASKLGTELYALHSVCYSICVFNENYSYPYSLFTVSDLAKYEARDRYNRLKEILLKYGWLSSILACISLVPLVYVISGELSIKVCIIYSLIYSLDIIPLTIYESGKGYLTAEGRTDILRYGGLIGVLVRIPTLLIMFNSGCGIYSLAIPCTVDFGVRAIFYYVNSKKHNRLNYSI